MLDLKLKSALVKALSMFVLNSSQRKTINRLKQLVMERKQALET